MSKISRLLQIPVGIAQINRRFVNDCFLQTDFKKYLIVMSKTKWLPEATKTLKVYLLRLGKQKVAELPGVGFALNQKLQSLNVVTCAELQRISMSVLRREFGQKTGEMLYKYSRGQDDRQLKIERERKSVSAEINYAIRFTQVRFVSLFMFKLINTIL